MVEARNRELASFATYSCAGKAAKWKTPIWITINELKKKYDPPWIRVSMSYHRFPNLREIFNGDLNSKFKKEIISRDYQNLSGQKLEDAQANWIADHCDTVRDALNGWRNYVQGELQKYVKDALRDPDPAVFNKIPNAKEMFDLIMRKGLGKKDPNLDVNQVKFDVDPNGLESCFLLNNNISSVHCSGSPSVLSKRRLSVSFHGLILIVVEKIVLLTVSICHHSDSPTDAIVFLFDRG